MRGCVVNDSSKAMGKELQKALQQVELAHQEWMAALDAVDDPIFLHDKDFRILRANRAYQQRAGISFKEIIGRPYYEIFPKADGPMLGCQSAMQTQDKDCNDDIVLEGRVYRSRTFPVYADPGTYLFSVHSLEDVTERKQSEERLRENDVFIKSVLDNLPVGIAVNSVDPAVNFSYMNGNFPRFYRTTREKLSAPDAFWNSVYEDAAVRQQISKRVLEDCASGDAGRMHWEDVPITRKGQEPFFITARNIPVPDKGLMISMVWDVTERKHAEEALKNEALRRRMLMQASLDGIAIHNEQHQVVEANARFAEMLGYTPEEMLALHTWDFEATMTEAEIRNYFADFSKASAIIETRHRRKDGTVFDVEVSIGGTMVGGEPMLFTVSRDITERKQHEVAMQRANRALRTISAGNQTLIHADEEIKLLQDMCDVAVQVGGYRKAWIGYARNDASKRIEQMAQSGSESGVAKLTSPSWGATRHDACPAGDAIILGKTQIVQDILGNSGGGLWHENAMQYGYASCIALPLMDGERAFGVMVIFDDEANVFDEDETRLLEEMSGDLAFGILTLRIKVAHREHAQRLQKSMLQTVEAIASIVELRDPYTSGHQMRVAELARGIARQMALSEEDQQAIHLAGVVHDLGKISVPAEILSKPGRLNDVEFSMIKMHPQAGYEILKGIDFSWPIAQIVLQHHERMDGSGYPQGLKGNEILLGARILSVADVVEAMSSHRPYRPGLGDDAALEEIIRGRGTHFDAQVVDACVAMFNEHGYVLPKYK